MGGVRWGRTEEPGRTPQKSLLSQPYSGPCSAAVSRPTRQRCAASAGCSRSICAVSHRSWEGSADNASAAAVHSRQLTKQRSMPSSNKSSTSLATCRSHSSESDMRRPQTGPAPDAPPAAVTAHSQTWEVLSTWDVLKQVL